MQTTVIGTESSRGWLDDALAALEPGSRLPPAGDPSKIGVVFVHGIGSQRAGETLLDWAKPLLHVVGTWSADHGGDYNLIHRASIDFSGATIPYVEVAIPAAADHPAQTWVMTEAWWAAQVRAPAIGEMASWLFLRGEGARVARGVAEGITRSFGGPVAAIGRPFAAVVVMLGALAAFPVYLLTRLIALVPLGFLRRNLLVRSFDYFLGEWFGDVRVMLLDRAQAAGVRSRLRRAIYALRAYGCGPIVVVGHSGGTFVSYMALAERTPEELPVDRLVTHGQALGMVWNLGRACDPPDPDDTDGLQRGDPLRWRLSERRPDLEWFDFWATHDPAPAGGFDDEGCVVDRPAPGRSIAVRNRASLRLDHGAYWDNIEEFVVPVARLIETASPTVTESRFYAPEHLAAGSARRTARVAALSAAKLALSTAGIVTLLTALLRLGPLADPTDATANAATAVGGLIVAWLAILVVSRVAASVWDGWDRLAMRRFLREVPPPDPRPMHTQLGIAAGSAMALATLPLVGWWPLLAVVGALLLVDWLWASASTRRARTTRSRPSGGPGSEGVAGRAEGAEAPS